MISYVIKVKRNLSDKNSFIKKPKNFELRCSGIVKILKNG